MGFRFSPLVSSSFIFANLVIAQKAQIDFSGRCGNQVVVFARVFFRKSYLFSYRINRTMVGSIFDFFAQDKLMQAGEKRQLGLALLLLVINF